MAHVGCIERLGGIQLLLHVPRVEMVERLRWQAAGRVELVTLVLAVRRRHTAASVHINANRVEPSGTRLARALRAKTRYHSVRRKLAVVIYRSVLVEGERLRGIVLAQVRQLVRGMAETQQTRVMLELL